MNIRKTLFCLWFISFSFACLAQATNKIENTGDVGIGTLTPNQKLDVVGLIRNTGGVVFKGLESGENGWIIQQGTDNLGIKRWNGAAAASYVNINENRTQFFNKVGIGTPSPDDLLHVGGTGSGPGSIMAGIRIGQINGPRILAIQESGDNDVQGLAFYTKSSALYADESVERMRIDNHGRVGLGTIQPDARLEIKMESDDTTAELLRFTDGDYDFGGIHKLSMTDGKGLMLRGTSSGVTSAEPSLILAGYANDVAQDHGFDAAVTVRAYNRVNNAKLNTLPTFKVLNGHEDTQIVVEADGRVGIGTNAPNQSHKLTVNGSVLSKKVKVQAAVNVPDYVFAAGYKLRSIEDLEQYIKENSHLPDVKSASEIKEEQGFYLEEMDMALLKKVEELTLYTIDQEKKIKVQEARLKRQDEMIASLLRRLEKLEKKD